MNEREALKQLLEALDKELPHNMKHIAAGQRFNARTVLAQPEQCRKEQRGDGEYVCDCKPGKCPELAQPEYQSTADKSKLEKVPAKGTLLAQPEQEPARREQKMFMEEQEFYTTPPQPEPDCREVGICVKSGLVCLGQPQRTWVGLTPQERDEINQKVFGIVPHYVAFHHAIEARLKEKNT